jgi:hypothetical protein
MAAVTLSGAGSKASSGPWLQELRSNRNTVMAVAAFTGAVDYFVQVTYRA